jgi:hypothetical protein
MWRIVQVSFNITPPVNIEHMFNGWLNEINKKLMYKILMEHLVYVGRFG